MAANIVPKTTAFEAQAAANLFLSNHLPDRFVATTPSFDSVAQVWRVPVVIAYPVIGPVGEVGEINVSVTSEAILSHTSPDEMMACARSLYEKHREAIEAAFLPTRNA